MRPRSGRGLLLAVALITTSPAAFPAPPPDSDPALGNRDVEALGRREAARIAAGRIEVAASASVDLASRQFTYSDPVGPLPVTYLLPFAPMASFGLETYPWASSNVPVLRDLGF